jgi:hypothetical protein
VRAANVSWADFARQAPELAAVGERLIYREPVGQGLLASVRDGSPPRIHPVYVAVMDGRLLTFINPSTKMADLVADGRYAFHNHIDPTAPSEFSVRGSAVPVDGDDRARIAAAWYFKTDERYRLFELLITSALLGRRDDPDAWPPIYERWPGGRPAG